MLIGAFIFYCGMSIRYKAKQKKIYLKRYSKTIVLFLKVKQYPAYYFYDVFEYQNFMKICHFGKAAEIKETVLHKTIRTIKENGLKSAFDKIIEMLWIKK